MSCSCLAWLPDTLLGYCLFVARALFTFGLAGLHVARVLYTFGLVALYLAWVFFNVGQAVVYFWLGWLTFG